MAVNYANPGFESQDLTSFRRGLRAARYGQYDLTSKFLGYFEKEDITSLPAGALVIGSQNVVSLTDGTIGNRKGYTLYGAADATLAPVRSSYDFVNVAGTEAHLRAGNTKLQFLYEGTWYDLMTGLTDAQCYFEFAPFFDTTEYSALALFVNKQSKIYEWNGAVATVASNTANTITLEGTSTWKEKGFNSTANMSVLINGVTYTYTGGTGTTTITGLAGLPALAVGTVVTQAVVTTLNAAMTGMDTAFHNTHISTRNNHLFVSAYDRSDLYMSKVNDYKNYSQATPRVAGDGLLATIEFVNPIFVLQEDTMYVSAGKDAWYQYVFEQLTTSTAQTEVAYVKPVTISLNQAVLNVNSVFKVKNSIFFLNNEVAMDEFGRVTQNFSTPLFTNYSDPVKQLFDRLNFTNACGIYYKYNIYIAVPAESIVLVYNIAKKYWEPPQTIPVSCFSIIGGLLYGHSNSTFQTYKLFDGYSDLGEPMDARAYFSYNHYGSRATTKFFNSYYSEGYMTSNASLVVGWNYEIDGCKTNIENIITGTDKQVCLVSDDSSLGKVSIGTNPLGGTILQSSNKPKFRKIDTCVRKDFYELQSYFRSFGKDFGWTILAFGPQVGMTGYSDVAIKD